MRSVVALGVALLGIGVLAVPVDQDVSLDARQVLDPGGPTGPGSPMSMNSLACLLMIGKNTFTDLFGAKTELSLLLP
jgi:hypothetical protein